MYGRPFNDVAETIRKKKKVLVIIGSQKVEIGVYQESDLNVSIGKQPHSEIGALAVYLDRLFEQNSCLLIINLKRFHFGIDNLWIMNIQIK